MAMFTPFVSADEGQDHDHDDDEEEEVKKLFLGIEGEILGTVALWTMIATLSILIWKPLRARLSISGHDWFKLEKKPFKKSLNTAHRRYMALHTMLGGLTAVIGTIHGYILEWHWTLWLGMAAIWILVISGSLLQWKYPPRKVKKGAHLLHIQRGLSIVAVIFLLIGHVILD